MKIVKYQNYLINFLLYKLKKSILFGLVLALVVGIAGTNILSAQTSTNTKTVSTTPEYVSDIESVKVSPKFVFSNVAVKGGSASEYYYSAQPNKTWWSGSENSLYVVESNSANGGYENIYDYPVVSTGFPLAVNHTFGTQAEKPYTATMVYDGGKSQDIYFPAFKPENSSEKIFYFYVADDGSTYYGDKENDGVDNVEKELLTVGEAMVPEHLARAAKDIITPCKNYQPVSFLNLYKEPKIDEGQSTVYYPASTNKVDRDEFGAPQNIGVRYSLPDTSTKYTLEKKTDNGSWLAISDLEYKQNTSTYIYPDKIDMNQKVKQYQYRIKAQTKDCKLAYSNTITRTPNPFQWRLDFFKAERNRSTDSRWKNMVNLSWQLKSTSSTTTKPTQVGFALYRTDRHGYTELIDRLVTSSANPRLSTTDLKANEFESYSYQIKLYYPRSDVQTIYKFFNSNLLTDNDFVPIEQTSGKDIVKVDAVVPPPPPPSQPDPKVEVNMSSSPAEITFGDNFALTVVSKNLPKGKITCYLPFDGGNTIVSSDCSEIKFEAKQANGELYYDGLGKESDYQKKKLVTIGVSVAVNNQIVGEATAQITVNPPKPKPLPEISSASGKWVASGLNLRSIFSSQPKYPDKTIELTWKQSPQDAGSDVTVTRVDNNQNQIIYFGKVTSENGLASELNPGVYDDHTYTIQITRGNEKGKAITVVVPALEKREPKPIAPETFTGMLVANPTLVKTDTPQNHVKLNWNFKKIFPTGNITISRQGLSDGAPSGEKTFVATNRPVKQLDELIDNPGIGSYRYVLTVANSNGETAEPKTADITIEKPVPPESPTDLQAVWDIDKNPAELNISWIQPKSDTKIIQYQVELLADALVVSSQKIAGSMRSIAFSEDPTQKYAIRLSALGQNGLSSTPLEIDIKPIVTKPLPLENGSYSWIDRSILDRINGKSAKLELSWDKSKDRFYTIDYYEIYKHRADLISQFPIDKTTTNKYTVTSADENGGEIYQILGVTKTGAKTDPLSINTSAKEQDVVPTPITINVAPGDTTAEIVWTFDKEYPVYQEIIRVNTKTGEAITIATLQDGAKKSNTYTDNTILTGEYIYQIIAKEIGGLGRKSQAKVASAVVVAPAPKMPQTQATQNDEGAVQINITAPTDADIITKVEILRSQDRVNFETIAVSGEIINEFIDQDPIITKGKNKTVSYKIIYHSSFGKKTESEPVQVEVTVAIDPEDGAFEATGKWVQGKDEPQPGVFENLFKNTPDYLVPPKVDKEAVKITWDIDDQLVDVYRLDTNGQKSKINDEPVQLGFIYDHNANPNKDIAYELIINNGRQINLSQTVVIVKKLDDTTKENPDLPELEVSRGLQISWEKISGNVDEYVVYQSSDAQERGQEVGRVDANQNTLVVSTDISQDYIFTVIAIKDGKEVKSSSTYYLIGDNASIIKEELINPLEVIVVNGTIIKVDIDNDKKIEIYRKVDGEENLIKEKPDKNGNIFDIQVPLYQDLEYYYQIKNGEEAEKSNSSIIKKIADLPTYPPPPPPNNLPEASFIPIKVGSFGNILGVEFKLPDEKRILSNIVALVSAQLPNKYFVALTATSQINFVTISEQGETSQPVKIADLKHPLTNSTNTWENGNNLRQDEDGLWHVVYADGNKKYYVKSKDTLGKEWQLPVLINETNDADDTTTTSSQQAWNMTVSPSRSEVEIVDRGSKNSASDLIVKKVTDNKVETKATSRSEKKIHSHKSVQRSDQKTTGTVYTENSTTDPHASPRDIVFENVDQNGEVQKEKITDTGKADLANILKKSNNRYAIVGWDNSLDIGGIFYQEGYYGNWSSKTIIVSNSDPKGLQGGATIDTKINTNDEVVVSWVGKDRKLHYRIRKNDGTLSEIADVFSDVTTGYVPKIALNSIAVVVGETLAIYENGSLSKTVSPALCADSPEITNYQVWVDGVKYLESQTISQIDEIDGLESGKSYQVFIRTNYCDGSYIDSETKSVTPTEKTTGEAEISLPTIVINQPIVETSPEEKNEIRLENSQRSNSDNVALASIIISSLALVASAVGPNLSSGLINSAIATSATSSVGVAGSISASSAVSALSNVALATSNSLRIFFFGWLPKRKRRGWAKVKNNDGKPIKGAIVKLFSSYLDRMVGQTITDSTGSFSFNVHKSGKYQIIISAGGFDTIIGKEFNLPESNISFTTDDTTLDYSKTTLEKDHPVFKWVVLIQTVVNFVYRLRLPIMVIGSIVAVYNEIKYHDLWALIVLILYILIWIVEFISRNQANSVGQVIDKISQQPLERVIVRLLKEVEKSEKLISTTVTDKKGEFNFIVPAGDYKITAISFGYQPFVSDIISVKKEKKISIKIALSK